MISSVDQQCEVNEYSKAIYVRCLDYKNPPTSNGKKEASLFSEISKEWVSPSPKTKYFSADGKTKSKVGTSHIWGQFPFYWSDETFLMRIWIIFKCAMSDLVTKNSR